MASKVEFNFSKKFPKQVFMVHNIPKITEYKEQQEMQQKNPSPKKRTFFMPITFTSSRAFVTMKRSPRCMNRCVQQGSADMREYDGFDGLKVLVVISSSSLESQVGNNYHRIVGGFGEESRGVADESRGGYLSSLLGIIGSPSPDDPRVNLHATIHAESKVKVKLRKELPGSRANIKLWAHESILKIWRCIFLPAKP
ncbi:hypothetical protein Dimus_030920 [Dionaea muscipula]